MSQKKTWLNDGFELVTPCRGRIAPDMESNKEKMIMTYLTEDYFDSYNEGFADGYNSGCYDFEFDCANPCIDEAHFDVAYESFLQGFREGESVCSVSTPNVVIGLQYHDADTSIPLNSRFLLSVEEASQCYGIGVKTLYRVIRNNPEADFILEIGSHYKIKRELFEEYLRYCTNLD